MGSVDQNGQIVFDDLLVKWKEPATITIEGSSLML